MNQLIALAAFMILSVGKAHDPNLAWQEQLVFVLGSAFGAAAIFLAAQTVVFFGARALRPADVKGTFTGTRLNYLTLGLLVFVISAQMKH